MTIESLVEYAMGGSLVFAEYFLGATVILLAGMLGVYICRHRSAAFRHRIWSMSVMSLLALPLLGALLPRMGPRLTSLDVVGLDPPKVAVTVPSAKSSALLGDHPRQSEREVAGEEADDPRRTILASSPSPVSGSTGSRRAGHWVWSCCLLVWISGAAVAGAFFLRGQVQSLLIVWQAVPITKGPVVRLKRQLCQAAGVDSNTPLLCSADVRVPVVVGAFRPRIIFPAGFGQWPVDRWRMVLAHEIAHVRRRDVLYQAIARLTRLCYWVHPLTWLAVRQMRVERELACDDAVLAAGESPSDYASHLLDVARQLKMVSPVPRAAVAIASRSGIERRVRAILHPRLNRQQVTPTAELTLAASTLILVVSISVFARASSDPRDPPLNSAARSSSSQPPSVGRKSPAKSGRDVVGKSEPAADEAAEASKSGRVPEIPERGVFELTVELGGKLRKLDSLARATSRLRSLIRGPDKPEWSARLNLNHSQFDFNQPEAALAACQDVLLTIQLGRRSKIQLGDLGKLEPLPEDAGTARGIDMARAEPPKDSSYRLPPADREENINLLRAFLWTRLSDHAVNPLPTEPRPANRQGASPRRLEPARDFTLTIRDRSGPYATSAYSFRFLSQDLLTHRNQVDLVYNRCGLLHVNTQGGVNHRIVDLGPVKFETVHDVPAHGWQRICVRPARHHVYVQEINDGHQTTYVKFLIVDARQDGTLRIRWLPLTAGQERPQFQSISSGIAGTMGQCGGIHPQR